MNTSEILTRAADLIEQRGWHRGWFCGPNGTLCAWGAMYAAVGMEPQPVDAPFDWQRFDGEAAEAVRRAVNDFDLFNGTITERWNDTKGRTKEEVITALRGAAEAARAER